MVIRVNPDNDKAEYIRQKIRENDGYCPCAIEKNIDTQCMCKDFRENVKKGYCHCGLYEKIE